LGDDQEGERNYFVRALTKNMTIPAYQDLSLPLLVELSDGIAHPVSDLRDRVARRVGVTQADRNLYLPSGRVKTYDNRIGWALKQLSIGELVETPSRGVYQITESGRKLLLKPPARIDRKFLIAHYPAAATFFASILGPQTPAGRTSSVSADAIPEPPEAIVTPTEALESAAQSLRRELAQQLADRIQANSPEFFEELVLDLVVALRYGSSRAEAAKHLGRTADGGVDGVINEDRLGLSRIFLQAKRWAKDRVVDVDVVRAFSGSLDERRSEKGILIATCRFTKPARDFADKSQKHIRLIDGAELTELMIDAGVGVTPGKTYVVKKVDSDYFDESADS